MNARDIARDTSAWVDDRPEEGVFRVHRDVFSDPEVFELEMKHIFGRTWVFLGIESEITKPNSYFTAYIGRTPVLVMRSESGAVGAYANVCPHKGALLCPTDRGTSKYHVCAYHGWAFDSAGRNVDIKDRKAAGYPAAFDQQSHDLIPLARVASYNGLVFGSLSADVPTLEEHLGEARLFIDLAMNQGPKGMEVVRGRASYTYRGNWKMQMDNGMDQYHLTSTHASFMDVQARRRSGGGNAEAQQFDWQKRLSQECGMFAFERGHTVVWMNQAEVEKRPLYPVIDEVRARVGRLNADWMLKPRNLLVFPNMQIADQTTLLIRTFRPLAVDRTEMRVHCIAPVGESPERRSWRLRQFEDFFNPTGLATPDDTTCFESLQRGYAAEPLDYLQGYFRGIELVEPGANEPAREIGITPTESLRGPFATNCETTLHAAYREWSRLMGRAAA